MWYRVKHELCQKNCGMLVVGEPDATAQDSTAQDSTAHFSI